MQDPWVRKIPWRRKWQPTPVILCGEFHEQRSLAGYNPWGHKELDPTERLAILVWAGFNSFHLGDYVLPHAAAAAAKSLQSCPTLYDPVDGSSPGSPVPGILQAGTLEWVAVSFSNAQKQKVKVRSLTCVRLLATPWTEAPHRLA